MFGLISSIISLNACNGSLPSSIQKGPATYHQRMDLITGGFRRSYRVYLPSGYDGLTRLPLVVVIHGAFDTAKGMEKFSGFSHLANRENFVVLYPEGIGIFGYLQHWNAGHCCGKAADDQIDDVGYLAKAINDVCSRLSIDRNRIYMVGFSNGGMMTYRFAAEHTDMLAAAAPIAASIGGRPNADAPEWRIPAPEKQLPILIMHGLDDDDIPFAGGVSLHRKGERTYLSVEASVQFWIDANGCEGTPVVANSHDGAVQTITWGTCADSSMTVLCKIEGWGHRWPGPYFTGKLAHDDPLYRFDAAEIIWSFFKQFP
ncbi:MAG: PHB depolymerase family esterase [Desulfobacterales bacterium]